MNLLDGVYTTKDAQRTLSFLDALSKSLYEIGKQSWEDMVLQRIPADQNQVFMVAPAERKAFVEEARLLLMRLTVLRLTMAFSPPQDFVEEICGWVRNNMAAEIVLDIQVDPSLVGGAQISYQGKFMDLTLKSKLDELLTKMYG